MFNIRRGVVAKTISKRSTFGGPLDNSMKMQKLPTWRQMHMDTSPEIEAIQFKFYRETPGWRKIEMMSSLTETVRSLNLQRLRELHPQASAEELKLLLLEHLYGAEIAAEVREALANDDAKNAD